MFAIRMRRQDCVPVERPTKVECVINEFCQGFSSYCPVVTFQSHRWGVEKFRIGTSGSVDMTVLFFD